MPIYESSSDFHDDRRRSSGKLFGLQKPIHQILGGGRVANLVLWRNPKLSAGVLIGVTILWFLFEILEYNIVTFICHIIIINMLVIFLLCVGADIFRWPPPEIPKIVLQESTTQKLALIIHKKFKLFLSIFFDVACGNNAKVFVLAIVMLWILSVIGNTINTLNLLYLGYLCLQTLPYVYEQYEEEVDELVSKMDYGMRKSFKKLDSNVFGRIPRGPVKEKRVK